VCVAVCCIQHIRSTYSYASSWMGICAPHVLITDICAPHLLINCACVYFVGISTHCNTLQHTATHCNTLQHTAYIQMLNLFLCIVVDGYMCSKETMEAAMNTTVGDDLRSTSDMIWKMMTKPRELFWCANAHVHTRTLVNVRMNVRTHTHVHTQSILHLTLSDAHTHIHTHEHTHTNI